MKLYGRKPGQEDIDFKPTRKFVKHKRKYQKKVHREHRKRVNKELSELVNQL